MRRTKILVGSLFLGLLFPIVSNAQNVGINTTGANPDASAMLDVSSTSAGMLIPRMTTAQKNAIASPATGLLVFDSTIGEFYYYNGTAWVPLLSSQTGWELEGNTGTTAGTNYVGTTDATDLVFKTNANEQMRIDGTTGFVGVNETNPTGAYIVVASSNSGNDGVKVTHTSGSAGAAYYAVVGSVSNAGYTNGSGYLAYHNSNNKTYGVYGTGGDLAGFFDGLVGVNSISTDLPTHDMEVRNNNAANPVNMLYRRTTQATVSGTEMVNIDFGDSYTKSAQAQIKVVRDAASGGATDLPTAMTFSTITDGGNTLSEGMRLTNGSFLGIGTTNPQQKLHVADDIIVGGGQNADYDGNTEHVKFWSQSKVWNVGVMNDAASANSDFFISQTDGTNDGTLNIDPNGNVGVNTNAATHRVHSINSTATTDVGSVYGYINNSTEGQSAYGILGYNTNDIDAVVKQIGVYGNSGTGEIAVAGRYSSTIFGYIGSASYGLYARHDNAALYAGYFQGDVHVNGTLSKSAGSFKIDHPDDPENKYLIHSFVESPDMMNIYNGNVITDGDGKAVITLPDYFNSLNKDFRYQLTPIGTFTQAIVSKKIDGNTFEIMTSEPNVEVSWQVTGVRNDPYAKAHPILTEEEKAEEDKGKYLNPDVYGKSEEEGMHFHTIENTDFEKEKE